MMMFLSNSQDDDIMTTVHVLHRSLLGEHHTSRVKGRSCESCEKGRHPGVRASRVKGYTLIDISLVIARAFYAPQTKNLEVRTNIPERLFDALFNVSCQS
jgi:hypothetical protein